jgi:methyl-accepting chemotaxis protein
MMCGVFFGSVFSNSLTRRLRNLGNVAREVSKGDLSKDSPVISRDEVRGLEEVFASMLHELREMINEMKTLSLKVRETNRTLTDRIRKMVARCREIDESARSIAESSEEQSKIVQETTVALEKGLENMGTMVRHSGEIVAKIGEAHHKIEIVESNAQETLRHLEDVLRQLFDYTQPMSRLVSKIEKIEYVTGVIDNIAQKTDLLSLNASIEATRAGEQGRGFALVANEIRGMAESSKLSSQEIGRIVKDILEENRTVMGSLGNTQKGVNKGREIIYRIVETFSEMLSGVKGISEEVKEIQKVTAREVQEMRAVVGQFRELSELANENFLSTRKTKQAARAQNEGVIEIVNAMKSLNVLSEKMMRSQQRFKLREE